ncbi:hypothetical protein SASPL_108690 [Salvia splendens]|uniref:Retrotransposon gag domain-containing protein n=1 Tax=Salvia splendens TaxID=180675 RepID=A0A8X9A6V9_SALSN|nr:hypothetical protein SASPL_108690 [Salvia splendens]
MSGHQAQEKYEVKASSSKGVENIQCSSIFGQFSEKEIITQLKGLARNPSMPQFAIDNIQPLWTQILGLRKLMALEASEMPWQSPLEDDTLVRVDGLEKAMAELTTHVRSLDTTLDERIRRCIEPVLRQLRGTPIEEPISEAHPHKSGENALDEDASSPTPTTAVPPSMALPSFDGTDVLVGLRGLANTSWSIKHQKLLVWISHSLRYQFARELIIRFGDYNTHDGYEALAATKHDGSLTDYISLFESRLAQLPDLTDPQYIGIFLAGLKPSIHMYLQDPSTYSDAVQMAKRYENISQSLAPTT